jgi:hypothetical protein
MKITFLCSFLLLLLFSTSACKKSKEARQLEKYLANTQWEFYYAEDAQGNDITVNVLQDSAICECFEFYKNDKNAVTFNTHLTKCHNTFFDRYKGNWSVFDYKKLKLTYNAESSSKWMSHGVAVGNIGIETNLSQSYLRNVSFYLTIGDKVMISKRYKLEFSGLPSDSLMEIRYYKKK